MHQKPCLIASCRTVLYIIRCASDMYPVLHVATAEALKHTLSIAKPEPSVSCQSCVWPSDQGPTTGRNQQPNRRQSDQSQCPQTSDTTDYGQWTMDWNGKGGPRERRQRSTENIIDQCMLEQIKIEIHKADYLRRKRRALIFPWICSKHGFDSLENCNLYQLRVWAGLDSSINMNFIDGIPNWGKGSPENSCVTAEKLITHTPCSGGANNASPNPTAGTTRGAQQWQPWW